MKKYEVTLANGQVFLIRSTGFNATAQWLSFSDDLGEINYLFSANLVNMVKLKT